LGGWPERLQKVVLGDRKPIRARPGASLKPLNLKRTRDELGARLKRAATEDDLYSHLMYPEVFAEFAKFTRDYSDVAVLPTPAFFYGLKPGEEISVDIEEGKTLFIKMLHLGAVDKDGRRTVSFELNGMARETTITDRAVQAKVKARPKADPADPMQVGAPMPGLITALSVSVGTKVSKGDKLLTLEAMKMQSTLYATCDGTVEEIFAQVGETVASKDLLAKLRK
jgi:pyruvate carboxylase